MIQLLPLNDVGSDFRPYDAASSFALEPMHLSLDDMCGVSKTAFASPIVRLRQQFSLKGKTHFDTRIKVAKLELLREMFLSHKTQGEAFTDFKRKESSWLDAYSHFKVLKSRFGRGSWENWPKRFQLRDPQALRQLDVEAREQLEFEKWLQWQAALQLNAARKEVNKKGVLLIGDLPFLVSRDSADVWANPAFFKLDRASGAPPDLYFADGQEWGMPPHDWAEQERTEFSYLRQKTAYASRFYDAFRIDHFVGLFRVWTYVRGLDGRAQKDTGSFDPPDESVWEVQGRKILEALLESSDLLPCAEDLGVVPDCSAPVLREFGIPGMEIQRWMRHWETTGEWKKLSDYRTNAIATLSTHDMTPLELWWREEAVSSDERVKFLRFIGILDAPDASIPFVEACLRASLGVASIFSIQLFQDWFSLEGARALQATDRINLPGLVDAHNWRCLSRYSTEEMNSLKANSIIQALLIESERVG